MRAVFVLAAVVGVCGVTRAADPSATTLIEANSKVLSAALTPDGKTLVTVVGKEQSLRVWDLATRKSRAWEKPPADIWSIAISPDSKTVAAGRTNGDVRLYDLDTGKERDGFRVKREGSADLAFSPDGKTLAAIDGEHVVNLHRVADGAVAFRLEHKKTDGRVVIKGFGPVPVGLGEIAWAPDGKTFYTLCVGVEARGFVTVWEADTGKEKRTVLPTRNSGKLVASPDGRWLAVGDAINRWVTLLDSKDDYREMALGITGSSCKALRFSADGKTLATLSTAWEHKRPTVELWDVARQRRTRTWELGFDGHWLGEILFLTSDGKSLITGGYNNEVRIWDLGE